MTTEANGGPAVALYPADGDAHAFTGIQLLGVAGRAVGPSRHTWISLASSSRQRSATGASQPRRPSFASGQPGVHSSTQVLKHCERARRRCGGDQVDTGCRHRRVQVVRPDSSADSTALSPRRGWCGRNALLAVTPGAEVRRRPPPRNGPATGRVQWRPDSGSLRRAARWPPPRRTRRTSRTSEVRARAHRGYGR
jgi:hypothetical protein